MTENPNLKVHGEQRNRSKTKKKSRRIVMTIPVPQSLRMKALRQITTPRMGEGRVILLGLSPSQKKTKQNTKK
jgi:hypothetical protein